MKYNCKHQIRKDCLVPTIIGQSGRNDTITCKTEWPLAVPVIGTRQVVLKMVYNVLQSSDWAFKYVQIGVLSSCQKIQLRRWTSGIYPARLGDCRCDIHSSTRCMVFRGICSPYSHGYLSQDYNHYNHGRALSCTKNTFFE